MALPVEPSQATGGTPPAVQTTSQPAGQAHVQMVASQVTVADLMDDEGRTFLLQAEQAGAEEDL